MSKQKWREKFDKLWPALFVYDQHLGEGRAENQVFDFFYSLHLQEVEKIREKVRAMKVVVPEVVEMNNDEVGVVSLEILALVRHGEKIGRNQTLDYVLLAITDEK